MYCRLLVYNFLMTVTKRRIGKYTVDVVTYNLTTCHECTIYTVSACWSEIDSGDQQKTRRHHKSANYDKAVLLDYHVSYIRL